ncbi:ASKHA domain-containing protein [Candidatus Leptofilum sp.]|uniref:ASKHA domain-containing protein n=1 Tax=Candidatus Leptofilum sp. TaxID=3241576 RepID=UPI003B5C8C26
MAEQSTPEHLVIFMPSGRRGRVPAGTLVLKAARQLGVEIESICGGRLTCNKCRVQVEEGHFAKHGIISAKHHLSPATEEEIRLLDKLGSPECRLSCNARICDDALIFVPEESWAHKQVVRKAATERIIELFPAVRQVYVEVDHAELGEHRGDWGRLQEALATHWHLTNLTIDLPVLRVLQANLRQKNWCVTVTLWQDKEVIDVQPGYQEGVYGLAVDIGSTTIAGFLCDLRTGDILATESMMNPQVTYGEDLMSRVSYAMMHRDGLEKMNTAVLEALNRLAASTAREAGIRQRDVQEAVFVGNTTMIHILLGISPIELGGAPFALANRDGMDVKARELGLRLHRSANVHVLPAEAGHVGADNVAALIAEEPYTGDAVTLLVDVGTNAEIVLGNKRWMLSASSPTGPAFEGAQIRFGMRAAPGAIERVRIDPETKVARFRVIGEERWSNEWQIGSEFPAEAQPQHLAAGICGSGIIEVVAEMFLAGILQPDGRFNPNLHHERIQWDGRRGEYVLATAEQTTTGSPIVVTQDDVRNIQLAKAALYAGVKLLMNQAGLTRVGRIVLAGAFGSYIDPKYAMILGLIPDCDLAQVTAVGNAAGDGARIALLNKHKRQEAQHISEWVTYVETAVHPDFQQEFVGAIHLPHASDAFPHLNHILPEAAPVVELNGNGRGKRKRRKKKRVDVSRN